ncbi:helix-turn-helix domain-containing protein [Nocardioides taihuensis]|uniref:Helix-turn-helix domain-containing protein n=1 Tax=Nocardioides taihuensis TaxID=1835606 RepID=A0ABW0BKE3_9ACTN
MDTEESDDWEARARVHAALADPARLRVVDHLALGDASASELQALLAMPSNLLAHHLGVLERAGLLTRRRSEADRRRSYWRLVPGPLDTLAPNRPRPTPRVVFVCTANSARSQLAAALWHRVSDVPATSAGTHPAVGVAPGAVRTAAEHGLDLTASTPQLLADVLAVDDLVIAVCDNAHETLTATPGPGAGTGAGHLHWSVPDPVRAGRAAAFDGAYDELAERVTRLAPHITTAPTSTAS